MSHLDYNLQDYLEHEKLLKSARIMRDPLLEEDLQDQLLDIWYALPEEDQEFLRTRSAS